MQSVSYGRAVPGGELGAAITRAAWHRSLLSGLISVPLVHAVPHPSTRTRPPTSCPLVRPCREPPLSRVRAGRTAGATRTGGRCSPG